MKKLPHTLLRWTKTVIDAYHKIMHIIQHPHKSSHDPNEPPSIPQKQPERPIDEPPISRRRHLRRKPPEPSQPQPDPQPPVALPAKQTSLPEPGHPPENIIERLASAEPAMENMREFIHQRKQLALLVQELENQKQDARAAARLARIRENLARIHAFEERMQAYIQNNQARALQRKTEIEAELLSNEQKIAELRQERERLARTNNPEDANRLEALEKEILDLSLANDDFIAEKALLSDALANPDTGRPRDNAENENRMNTMQVKIDQNIQRLTELENERQTLLRSHSPDVSERLREISETIHELSAAIRSNNNSTLLSTNALQPTPERKQKIDNMLQEHTARIQALEAERASLLKDTAEQAQKRLTEIDKAIRQLQDTCVNLARERDMIVRSLTPPSGPVPLLGQDQMVHISAMDDHKREAKVEAQRETERHKQIIAEQKTRARERAEREAAILRKRTAEIEAQRAANIAARRKGTLDRSG